MSKPMLTPEVSKEDRKKTPEKLSGPKLTPEESKKDRKQTAEEFWKPFHSFWPDDDERFRYFTGPVAGKNGDKPRHQQDHFGLPWPRPLEDIADSKKRKGESEKVPAKLPRPVPIAEKKEEPLAKEKKVDEKPKEVPAAKPQTFKKPGPPAPVRRVNGRIVANAQETFIPTRIPTRPVMWAPPSSGKKKAPG